MSVPLSSPSPAPDQGLPREAPTDREIITYLRNALRTPLNQIIGFAELLLEGAGEDGEHANLRSHLSELRGTGDEINTYLGYTLVQWKIDAGQVNLAKFCEHTTSLVDVLAKCRDQCEADARELNRGEALSDLRKIRHAVENFAALLEHDSYSDRRNWSESPLLYPDSDNSKATASPTSRRTDSTDYRKILIVDDQEMNREVLLRRLKRMGYVATAVEDGQAALALMRREPFDLVLLDIVMPVMDGFEMLMRLKADEVLRDIPVIMLTAVDDPSSTVRCIEAGADDYVSKPHNPVILNARINASLERKRLHDVERAYLSDIQAERAKSEHLLLNILPKPISERLKQGERFIVEDFENATVLFADIVGFTHIAVNNSGVKTVNYLNEIFSALDLLSQETGVEKVKTIGDAYMVVAGCPVPQEDHALRVARTALGILKTLEEFNQRHGVNWQVRIGIHSGPLVAGIIGSKKFNYDLWGDTVNVASRLESNGEPGVICISEATAQLLSPHCVIAPRGKLLLKNRGEVMVYQLISIKS